MSEAIERIFNRLKALGIRDIVLFTKDGKILESTMFRENALKIVKIALDLSLIHI